MSDRGRFVADTFRGVGKVGRSSLVEHGLDTIHKLKNANKMQVQQALG